MAMVINVAVRIQKIFKTENILFFFVFLVGRGVEGRRFLNIQEGDSSVKEENQSYS